MKKIILFFIFYIFSISVLFSQVPSSPILIEPPKQASVVSLTPTLTWEAIAGADGYFIFITTDTTVSPTLETNMSTAPNYEVPSGTLVADGTYYWYVKAHNINGWSDPSPFYSFTTQCETVTGSLNNLIEQVNAISGAGRLSLTQATILNNRLEQAIHQLELNHEFVAMLNVALFKFRVFILRISDQLPATDAASINYSADGVIDLIQDLSKPMPLPTELAKEFKLTQNYPNPFNPVTTIEYSIPDNSNVTLKVYDILGKEVAVIVDKFQNQGSYIVNWDASNLSSGVYIYKLAAGNFSDTKKMVLSK